MANENLVLLQNLNDTKTEVFAADGNSISLMPNTKISVEKKYLWRLPKGVREYREDYTVFGKKPKQVNTTVKSGNKATSDSDRTVLDTNESTDAKDVANSKS